MALMDGWLRTNFAGYSCEFSPFHPNLLAVSSAQYYGIVGNGQLQIFDLQSKMPVVEWLTKDGVYDASWSEDNEHVIATAQGDGTVKLFDFTNRMGPIASFEEHQAEVYGVDWNMNMKTLICSASWDNTIKVWDVPTGRSMRTYRAHMAVAYASIWAPQKPAVLASVAGDGMLNICDVNVGNEMPVQQIQAHQHEVLTCDWNKYNEFQVVTGSVDKTLRVFDLRNPAGPLQQLFGHQLAVRRVKCHPFAETQVVSASYDMTVNIFDTAAGQMMNTYGHHSEFVLGIDLSLFEEGLMASAAWDRTACVWNFMKGPPQPCPPGLMMPRPA